VSLTSASLLGPAALSASPVMAQTVVAQDVDEGTTTEPGGYRPLAAGWPGADEGTGFWRPSAAATTDEAPGDESVGEEEATADDMTGSSTQGLSAAATTHMVVVNDNLWEIAERHLRQVAGRDVTEDEVAQYWARVVDANRDTVISGDPNLIYPHEQIALPPVYNE
jgi:LysM repeat protein